MCAAAAAVAAAVSIHPPALFSRHVSGAESEELGAVVAVCALLVAGKRWVNIHVASLLGFLSALHCTRVAVAATMPTQQGAI